MSVVFNASGMNDASLSLSRNESGTFVCELSDSDRFFGFGNFTEDDNFTYRGMQVII